MHINLDLDTYICNDIKLGEPISNPSLLKAADFTVYTRSNKVSGMHISIGDSESRILLSSPKSTRIIVRKGIKIYDSQTKLSPENILALYPNPQSHWDDGSEVNYQFSEDGIHTEYSWCYRDEGLNFAYISIELELNS